MITPFPPSPTPGKVGSTPLLGAVQAGHAAVVAGPNKDQETLKSEMSDVDVWNSTDSDDWPVCNNRYICTTDGRTLAKVKYLCEAKAGIAEREGIAKDWILVIFSTGSMLVEQLLCVNGKAANGSHHVSRVLNGCVFEERCFCSLIWHLFQRSCLVLTVEYGRNLYKTMGWLSESPGTVREGLHHRTWSPWKTSDWNFRLSKSS